jgi:hypothetical protein
MEVLLEHEIMYLLGIDASSGKDDIRKESSSETNELEIKLC